MVKGFQYTEIPIKFKSNDEVEREVMHAVE